MKTHLNSSSYLLSIAIFSTNIKVFQYCSHTSFICPEKSHTSIIIVESDQQLDHHIDLLW